MITRRTLLRDTTTGIATALARRVAQSATPDAASADFTVAIFADPPILRSASGRQPAGAELRAARSTTRC